MKMPRKFSVLFLVFWLLSPAIARSETLITHETEKYFYRDGKMEKFEGQYENTYYLDLQKNSLIRTRVYDFQTKKITPDETVYDIQKDLSSHPTLSSRYNLAPMIRAFGHPKPNEAELLVIEDDQVHTTTSTPAGLVISRSKRLK